MLMDETFKDTLLVAVHACAWEVSSKVCCFRLLKVIEIREKVFGINGRYINTGRELVRVITQIRDCKDMLSILTWDLCIVSVSV